MCLLPSNVNPHIKPPSHSTLHRRSTFPYIEHTRWSPPNDKPTLTPPKTPKAHAKDALRMSVAMQVIGDMPSLLPTPEPEIPSGRSAVPAAETASQIVQQRGSEATESNQSSPQLVTTPASAKQQMHLATATLIPGPIDNHQRHAKKLRKRSSARDRARQVSLRRQYSEAENAVPSDNTSVTSTLRRLSVRRKSTKHEDYCHDIPHTPIPSQDITPARPPFFKEMLGYFTDRSDAGKQILPSRISEASGRDTSLVPLACLTCGKPVESRSVHGVATKCERCILRSSETKVSTSGFGVDLPGAWSPGRS